MSTKSVAIHWSAVFLFLKFLLYLPPFPMTFAFHKHHSYCYLFATFFILIKNHLRLVHVSGCFIWWAQTDLNCRPTDYEFWILHIYKHLLMLIKFIFFLFFNNLTILYIYICWPILSLFAYIVLTPPLM